ncbi:MAG: hypothetical protein GX567_00255 [Clostridia bacterium]|nr:hypothetical protein [Clostridia bacterium]
MEVINRISEGLHLDNNEYDQPAGTMRDNRNGLIYDIQSGRYIWRGLNGTTSVLTLAANEFFMGYAKIRHRHFIITLNLTANQVKIKELFFSITDAISSTTDIWTTTNDNLQLNPGYPIRAMFGVYENDEIIRLYFTDFHNQPRVISLAGTAPLSVNEKFIELTPELNNGYGKFSFVGELSGGSLMAGMYFFAWRFYKDGYYSDWSPLTTPVPIFNGSPGTTYSDYHNVEGAAPNDITTKGIEIQISDIDDDYDTIQIAAFYSNDVNSIASGSVIYEGAISGTSMNFEYYGGEESTSVSISQTTETSLFIKRCKDMCSAGKYNVIANIEERDELDITSLNTEGKNNKIDVQITPLQYSILLDTREYGPNVWGESYRPASGILPGTTEIARHNFIPGLYHEAITAFSYNDISGIINVSAGQIFKPSLVATYISGTAKLTTVIKKYRKSAASLPYNINDDYEIETKSIDSGYYNYKNPYFCNKLMGYPSGEKIRLGVLFLDKTGRPYFVRHLNNTETTYYGMTIGPGDTRIPERYETGAFPICGLSGHSYVPYEYYEKTIGYVNHLSISGLDITAIKDLISAFMIVRCPIERENIAYGALGFTYESGNDLYSNFSFRAQANDAAKKAGIYVFFCPEDMFEFSGFSIQPGDRIENKYYMTPFDPTNAEETGLEGYGVLLDDKGYGINLYQKFYVWNNDSEVGNAAKGAEHEVLYYTKYRQGDGDEIIVDPRNSALALRNIHTITVDGSPRSSYLTNLGIVVLDIDDSGTDVKGMFDLDVDDPHMLVCSIKRPNASVYGGLTDSGLASSIYIPTGHYQEINNTVLADVLSGGAYVFNEIDVFGGDTYVCIWDFIKLMANEDVHGSTERYSHSVFMPIETRINLDLREGNHIGKDRVSTLTSGLGLEWRTGANKWEEFNYNDGYSSDNPGRHFLPVPVNFTLQNEFDTDIRYSDPKEYGEYEDSFRKFRPLNKYQIDKKFGQINNIKYKFNNLIYWQTESVGYIPIGERALISNDLGKVVQLGVSGIFDRNDNLIESVGNSNQFGLVESNNGFHWYDAIKKLFITITNSLKITPDSLALGLDSYFENEVPVVIRDYDYPASGFGISGGFDPKDKMVYLSFRTASFIETVGFSIKDNKFTGFYDFDPGLYFNANNALYSSNFNLDSIHHFGSGVLGQYFGVSYPRYFTIIVRDDSHIAKIFDTFEVIGNDEFFTYLNYALENGDNISEYLSGSSARHVNQKLKYRNKRWFGNFPKISHERLVGGYCKITFVNTGTSDARFYQLNTLFREMI